MDNAHLYARNSGMQRRDNAAILRDFGPRLRWEGDEDVVLDVGSGTGDVTAELLLPLLPERVRVVGADISPAMVQHAAREHQHPRLRFVEADIGAPDVALKNSPLWKESGGRGYSKIFSFFCLHWVQDHCTAFSNIYQLLRAGGEALVIMVAQSYVYDVHRYIQKIPEWNPYMFDVSKYISPYHDCVDPVRECSNIIIKAGFKVKNCFCDLRVHEFNDEENYRDTLLAINPFAKRIPEEKLPLYTMDMLNEMMKDKNAIAASGENKNQKLVISQNILIAHIEKSK